MTDAGRELVAVVDRQRAAWLAKLDARAVEARTEFAATVQAMEAARSRWADQLALAAWLADFPQRTRWPVSYLGRVPSLRGRNGDPLLFDGVVQALLEMAQPTEPKRALSAVPSAEGPTPA